MLRQISRYDWLFPVEQHDLQAQLEMLGSPSPAVAAFARITLSPATAALAGTAWARDPVTTHETLTADLWATGQIDSFRAAASALPHPQHAASTAMPRLVMVVISPECTVSSPDQMLFERLRPHGCVFNNVQPGAQPASLLTALHARAAAHPAAFGHWYIDGDAAPIASHQPAYVEVGSAPVVLDYASLHGARRDVMALMAAVIQGKPARFAGMPESIRKYEETQPGPEALRTRLSHLTPEDLGLAAANRSSAADLLAHFQVEVLGQGSGTQLYSTVFVQWTAREILRRAQPATLMLRFTPRSVQVPLEEADRLLAGTKAPADDPQGSLVDADMGTYYTWLNLLRLPGADQSAFLAWHQGSSTAFVAGPTITRGVASSTEVSLDGLLGMLNAKA
jgi:hypothetical protein